MCSLQVSCFLPGGSIGPSGPLEFAINACAQGAQRENAIGLQASMAHQPVEVNTITYNSAINACANDAQLKTVITIAREEK